MKNEGVLFFICFELCFMLFYYSLLDGVPIYTSCFIFVFILLEHLFCIEFLVVILFFVRWCTYLDFVFCLCVHLVRTSFISFSIFSNCVGFWLLLNFHGFCLFGGYFVLVEVVGIPFFCWILLEMNSPYSQSLWAVKFHVTFIIGSVCFLLWW